MDKRKLLIIGGGILALLLIVFGIVHLAGKGGKSEDNRTIFAGDSETKRQNILRLASSYAEAGEYDRALNLLDGLLI
jgi:hypothetical protein